MGTGAGRGLLWLGLALLGCGRSEPPATPAPSSPRPSPSAPSRAPDAPPAAPAANRVSGKIGQSELRPKSAIYLWREKANDLTVLLTDADDPCAALTAGAWPRGAVVLHATIKHNGADNRDAHFAAGEYPLRQGGAKKSQDTKDAVFLALDPSCSPVARSRATAGWLRLTTPDVTVAGVAEGTFDFTMEGGERMEGTFSARHCPTPENEPRGCR